MPTKADIVLVDDHVVLRNSLAAHLATVPYRVLFEADNGKDFIEKMNRPDIPDLVLLDINMRGMDGYDTALWLKKQHPDVKVLALSMYDDEHAVIRMLRNGARGYVLKDCGPAELHNAIEAVLTKGFYYSEMVTGKLVHAINHLDEPESASMQELLGLSAREIEFLKLACTEMTYKEIADRMHLSPRTIDGYRDALFEKLNVKSRVGLVLFAIKNGIVTV